jgi:bifunctional enzyme CysN/CysC
VLVQPSGKAATVKRLADLSGDRAQAVAGEAVTIVLEEEVDIARGELLCDPASPAQVTDQVQATVLWMDEEEMLPERQYRMLIGSRMVNASITELRHVLDVNTGAHMAARTLTLNAVGECNLALDQAVAFDPYGVNRTTGAFILIDRYTNRTLGAGMIRFVLRRATNLTRQELSVEKVARAGLKGQRPAVLWFTGMSGAGNIKRAALGEPVGTLVTGE